MRRVLHPTGQFEGSEIAARTWPGRMRLRERFPDVELDAIRAQAAADLAAVRAAAADASEREHNRLAAQLRDAVDGRPRGVLTKFGISRVRFRDMAHHGELPGITKSSW